VSGIFSNPLARRLESWEARKPEAMTFLSLQASKLPSLPAIFLTPDPPSAETLKTRKGAGGKNYVI